MPKFRPPHIYKDETIYFITGRTVDKQPFLITDQKKKLFLQVLKKSLMKFNIKIFTFVINDDHYHCLIKVNNKITLPKFIANLHANSARLINHIDGMPSRKIWYQYWDRCIRNEKDFWVRFNYIHHNPIKHGYINNQECLLNYFFCSYHLWLRQKGEEWLDSIFEFYPIKDFTLEDGD